jgi:hypothetical protein
VTSFVFGLKFASGTCSLLAISQGTSQGGEIRDEWGASDSANTEFLWHGKVGESLSTRCETKK